MQGVLNTLILKLFCWYYGIIKQNVSSVKKKINVSETQIFAAF